MVFSVRPLSCLSRLRIIGIREAPPVTSTTSTCAQPSLLSFSSLSVMSSVRSTSGFVSFWNCSSSIWNVLRSPP